MYKVYEKYLNTLHNAGKYRRLGALRQESNPALLDFSTNDYLNLSNHRDIVAAGEIVARKHGIGSTGSRLLSGNCKVFEEFESIIAKDKNTDASLIFNSGFQANISTLACLLDDKILNEKPLVFFDKLNHSSLYQAVFLSKAELKRYHHNDINNLESLLKAYQNDTRPKFIVTETVFGMDGDIAPLHEIAILARKFNAFLYLDEAHSTGVFGLNGYGLSTSIDLQDVPHIIMGTFSKAIGVSGGYIACHHIMRHFIINKATGFMYSTAASPAVVGAAFKAWQLVRSLDKERETLQNLGNILRKMLKERGFNIGLSQTHIIPVILNDEDKCLKIQKALFQQDIVVSCIRPPTVPPGTSRLRIALTTKHNHENIDHLVESLTNAVES
ncbi:MAG: 8-amino-7-oxononanoate synthase [Gammaproteobacteria bacterium]|nr:8-amino-7-oxononanoate synthase [Gammaproteobacteria bacterium]